MTTPKDREPTEEQVEAVARALVPILSGGQEDMLGRDLPDLQFDELPLDWQERHREYARTAIRAMVTASPPDHGRVTWELDEERSKATGWAHHKRVPAPHDAELSRRLEQMKASRIERGDDHIVTELLERATYLHAMQDEGLSTISRQSMEAMYRATDELAAHDGRVEKALRMCLAMVNCHVKPDARCVLPSGGKPFTATEAHSAAVAVINALTNKDTAA